MGIRGKESRVGQTEVLMLYSLEISGLAETQVNKTKHRPLGSFGLLPAYQKL